MGAAFKNSKMPMFGEVWLKTGRESRTLVYFQALWDFDLTLEADRPGVTFTTVSNTLFQLTRPALIHDHGT